MLTNYFVGLSREVMALRGTSRGNGASLVPTLVEDSAEGQKKFKAKIKLRTKRVGKWEKKPFKNPGRKDGVMFVHWAKAKQLEETYKYAKRNRRLAIPKYNDAEYESYFKTDQWTKEETDYLFEMCNTYDLRFIVICDRWEPPVGSKKVLRTVEELKDRYYMIQRGLLPLRKVADEDMSQNPLLKHVYDPLREAERKRQEDESTHRTEEDLAVESEITSECGRIDATFKRHAEDALKYLRLIKKQQKYFNNLKLERMAYQAAKELDERTKAKRAGIATPTSAMDVDTTTGASTAPTASSTAPAIAAPLTASGNLKLSRRHPAAYSRTHAKPYVTPLTPQLNQPKYNALFAKAMPELGIESVPKGSFVMAAAVTELRCDLVLLHEMQRITAEKSYELDVLRRLHKSLQDRLKSSPSIPSASRPSHSSSASAMAVDK